MSVGQFSEISSRKQRLNQLCASAVKQQICCNETDNTHLRNRRRFLAKQVQKRLSLTSFCSNQRWLHVVTLVLAMWGFNDLVVPNHAQAAAKFESSVNPLAGVNVGLSAAPSFADIVADNDFDAFVGGIDGFINYYRNDGTPSAPSFVATTGTNNLLGVVSVGTVSSPSFANLDGDGDLDAFVGASDGSVRYFRNDGPDNAPIFTPVAGAGNPFDMVNVGNNATPSFADLDGDGDRDAFVGASDGSVRYFRNDEVTPGAPIFTPVAGTGNPFDMIDVGDNATPSFVDIDNDGDFDAFVGESNGRVKYYLNSGSTESPSLGGAVINPLLNRDVGYKSNVSLADIDGDGDLDVFVGERYGSVRYYQNGGIGSNGAPVFSPGIGIGNPLDGVDVVSYSEPSFADLDGDGDLDVFVGAADGTVKYYHNKGTPVLPDFEPIIGIGNPFNMVNVGSYSNPSFADLDGDGDLDAFVGAYDGTVKYFQNVGTNLAPSFTAMAGTGNPLDLISLFSFANVGFVDVDGDGDLDAFVGQLNGTILYYRNEGTPMVPDFVKVPNFISSNPLEMINVTELASPAFADIDGDGDLDAFVGAFDGTIKFYRNSDPAPVPAEDTLSATAGMPATTVNVKANDTFKIEVPAQFFNFSVFDATTANGGMVLNNGDGTFTYTQTGSFVGIDSFTYTLSDGVGNSAVGIVTVTVSAAAAAPAPAPAGGGGGGGLMSPWMTVLCLQLLTLLRRFRKKTG